MKPHNVLGQCLLRASLREEMAESRFAPPISDASEKRLRNSRIPNKTQSTTAWGIHVWSEWASACASIQRRSNWTCAR